VLAGCCVLTLGADHPADLAGLGPERLARRIETATDGRFRLEVTRGHPSPDMAYGLAGRHAHFHPGFAFFAGLPLALGLEAGDQQAWLAVGGGQMLWDELAAGFGFKPLIAGHTGPSAGVWASARLETPADLAGAALHLEGLAADAAERLGAACMVLPPQEIRAALGAGRIRAAEWLGPLAAVSPNLQPLAQRLYEPGLHRAGMTLSLDVRRPVWEAMSAADQTIIEACASQEYQLSLAEARAHALIAAQVAAPAKWPLRLALPEAVVDALETALAEVVEGIAGSDPAGRRIHDSYQAFRQLLHEDVLG
jgi:TRAP-type mannitol/chloroaromatic compound transport system substrate-binding protein